jgi:hypothetical protein
VLVEVFLFAILLTIAAWLCGCAATGAGFVTPTTPTTPKPPPPATSGSVTVTVTPSTTAIILGNTQMFTATVTNASDASVIWSVNDIAGGDPSVGTISTDGLYTAPIDLPAIPTVQIAATSAADTTKSGTSAATITSDLQIALTPAAASVELGGTRAFQASLTSAGHPNPTIRWTLSGAACSLGCGTIDSNGDFTAPQILPLPATTTLTAQSVADPSKCTSAAVTITSNFTLQVSAPANVAAGASAGIVATLTPAAGSNPSPALTWSLSGSGCSSASCGVLAVVSAQSAGGSANANSATYLAPSSAPSPNIVTIVAIPQADPSKRAQATLAILQNGGVILSPTTTTIAANHRITLTAQVIGSPAASVTWSVNGIAGGNATVGQICDVFVNPCVPVTSGTAAQVDYLAPGAIPSPNPVTVQATSAADSTKSAISQITVLNHPLVNVQPGNVTLAPRAVQGFSATVSGANNQSVVWQVQGTACTGGAACGSITATGVYSAPASAPSPNSIQVIAVSSDDPSQSGTANVAISTGANILAIHPASVYAGAADGFTLRVDGSGFAGTTPGPASMLLISGSPRIAACSATTECTVPLMATDVVTVGNVTVQVQNPNGTSSNAVSLVVAAPNIFADVISLTSVAPTALAQDITVVEPTTAGVSLPGDDVDLNLAALGSFSVANNSCTLAGNPVALQRPSSGTVNADICMFSESGLDTSMTFSISGPGDIVVIAQQPPELGIVRITLQIPATALSCLRTLFVQNPNLDKAAASGSLQVN